MELLPLVPEHLHIGHPLPWGVRDPNGKQLLNKGQILSAQKMIDDLIAHGCCVATDEFNAAQAAAAAPVPAELNPFQVWSDIQQKLNAVLRDFGKNPDVIDRLAELAALMQNSGMRDVDVSIFEMVSLDLTRYPVAHALQCAFLSTLVAKRMELSETDTATLIKAALTMNISFFAAQARLVVQEAPPTAEQRVEIETHALRSRQLLEHIGVKDQTWLRVVELHHLIADMNPDDEGLVGTLASILHHTDVYLAKLANRASRRALPPNLAAKDLIVKTGGTSNSIAAAIIKEFGIFPPGTYVKLKNGEISIVVRRGKQANTPVVYSLSNTNGVPFMEPVRRETQAEEYQITSTITRDKVAVRLNRSQLFGLFGY